MVSHGGSNLDPRPGHGLSRRDLSPVIAAAMKVTLIKMRNALLKGNYAIYAEIPDILQVVVRLKLDSQHVESIHKRVDRT